MTFLRSLFLRIFVMGFVLFCNSSVFASNYSREELQSKSHSELVQIIMDLQGGSHGAVYRTRFSCYREHLYMGLAEGSAEIVLGYFVGGSGDRFCQRMAEKLGRQFPEISQGAHRLRHCGLSLFDGYFSVTKHVNSINVISAQTIAIEDAENSILGTNLTYDQVLNIFDSSCM